MKLKRILASALVCVMMFASVSALLPTRVSATYSSSVGGGAKWSLDNIKKFIASYKTATYASEAEMLAAEIDRGIIDQVTSADGKYTIFVNRYSGVMYYRNNATGQMITSNPYDYSSTKGDEGYMRFLSQITIHYYETSNSAKENSDFNSAKYAAMMGQISISPINNGLRVNYTMGDTATRYLAPGLLTYDTFIESIAKPLITGVEQTIAEALTEMGKEVPEELDFFGNPDNYDSYGLVKSMRNYVFSEVKKHTKDLPSALRTEVNNYCSEMATFFQFYTMYNPQKYLDQDDKENYDKLCTKMPILKEGTVVFALSIGDESSANSKKKQVGAFISQHIPGYTFSDMYEHERETGYVDNTAQNPIFRCALEYSFNEDGSLKVTLPASSITFDDTVYTMKSITALPYIGAADMGASGYAFYPDGSGTIVSFDDFYSATGTKNNIVLSSDVYGKDYCYSTITGSHREQITMPVYGIVTEKKIDAGMSSALGIEAGKSYTSGYFAVIEEGSALASIVLRGDASASKYVGAYATYNPYPSDTFDLSETISVGSLGSYTITSESKYTGNYTTRYVMLSDATVGTQLSDGKHYDASYVGMASCYRDLLYREGVLTALETVSENIPLYIESLGSMSIDAKFLSFPIKKKVPLTTFNDILTMYRGLATAKDSAMASYEELIAKAETEEDPILKAQYESEAAVYLNISENCQNITNINFKLTGFANGGMYSTYPTKVRWERKVGGKSAFRNLVAEAKQINDSTADESLGIYPDFDFMYIENTSTFDGIGKKNNVSRMVDNRYASRQQYDMISQDYDSDMALVISPDVLSKFYQKLSKKYSKYDLSSISVSTLGSQLNSNFDEENPINREQAIGYVAGVLSEMSESYDIMLDTGNVFTLKYASHILNAATDASHFKYSSYIVPFVGMILHGSVNYAGSALNYSGTPAYDVLRALESGAAPYYILCYQDNTAHMKEDPKLNEYYSVDYQNWYTTVVETYAQLNRELGPLQSFKISDHKILIAERVIDPDEVEANNALLKAELLAMLEDQLAAAIEEKFTELRADSANIGRGFTLRVDKAALLSQFATLINVETAEFDADFVAKMDALLAEFASEYNVDGPDPVELVFSEISYENSAYDFITDSEATAKDYDRTDYTVDNGNVVMVTYSNGTETYSYILNYNIYSVTVVIDGVTHTLAQYGYEKL